MILIRFSLISLVSEIDFVLDADVNVVIVEMGLPQLECESSLLNSHRLSDFCFVSLVFSACRSFLAYLFLEIFKFCRESSSASLSI